MTSECDVAIIGGGPAGSTAGTLLRKYNPALSVLILEREVFPRDHVGESQLPVIGGILDEMGVWDKVEAAGFPIKVGATYRWGATQDLWNFEFLPDGRLQEQPRPAPYEGQRTQTAFQVDRALYDKILLDHAREVGCEVREGARVREVEREGDRVTGLLLDTGERVTARHYVDASGGPGIIRRAMGVEVESPTSLRNIAIWDYWRNAEWAEEIGVGGTRVQVLSLGYGWIWFIPLGPTRTSVGLIVPAKYYKESGKRPAELYAEALTQESRISALMQDATSEGKLQTTNDWSFVADRLAGENWFLAGDSCGFADPILAAGMTLAHAGAREVAYSILELDRGELDAPWLRGCYSEAHRRRIGQHIRFADYWYSANGCFTDLLAYTSEIAWDAGLDLDPQKAFQWLGTGGFANDDYRMATIGLYGVAGVKRLSEIMSGERAGWGFSQYNEFRLNLGGAKPKALPHYENGRVRQIQAYERNGKLLPLAGAFMVTFAALQKESDLDRLFQRMFAAIPVASMAARRASMARCIEALETMLAEGWVTARLNPRRPRAPEIDLATSATAIHYVDPPVEARPR